MLKDVVNILKDVSLRHVGVRTFRYNSKMLINAQNNYPGYQVYLDDVSYHQLNITTNIFRVDFNLHILGHPDDASGNTILDIQNDCYTIAADILAYIDTKPEFYGILSVYDYSIITVSHFSDDDSAGVKLSLTLEMPSPVNLCTLDDNFNDEPYPEDPDHEIDIDVNEVDEIDIKPIHLPRNREC